ncbi:hypothetical protein ACFW1M_29060 [Streptomyces inhibens]|uniref:hypothetical protein n=1 Tax=Streptomyces inhibens TaxID=2293571 RepID=UPI0036C8B585
MQERVPEDGIVLLSAINKVLGTDFGPTLLDVVVEGQRPALEAALQDKGVLDTVSPPTTWSSPRCIATLRSCGAWG